MSPTPIISDAEWKVMQVVWGRQPVTASDVVAALQEAGETWHARTIKTMLSRLLRKGAVVAKPEGNRYVYHANVQREACVRDEARSFLHRVCAGDAVSAMMHLAEQADLSPGDIEQLQKLLREDAG